MIGNFQTSKSFNIREREYRCLQPVIKIACKPITTMGGVSSVLKTERNNICVANVNDQSARKYKEKFSTETEDQGSLYPVLKSSNTKYCFFASSHCSVQVLVSKPECRDFLKFNRSTDLNFNMNKRQGTLFNFSVKKSRIEAVCDATNNDSSTSSLQSDLQDVQKEGETTSTQKKKSAFTCKHTDSYLKFGFIQCPDTGQLPRPQCVILCYCSGK